MTTPAAGDLSAPRPPRRISLVRRVSFAGFAGLIVVGVAFYFWWGFRTGYWLDNGVYAVTAVLIAFGLAGIWLVLPEGPRASPPPS
jgi:hypothetical protein